MTLILRGDIGSNATLALAIDTAKENGYSIDAVSVFTPRNALGRTLFSKITV
jgi:hypothetical protein